jgi:alkylated DNA repair protein (DNA oxidative demethylase)
MSRMSATDDLFGGTDRPAAEPLAAGATLLAGFATSEAIALMRAVEAVAAAAPFRHMVTPGGYRMSVAMTSCGTAGWVTDRRGYRYDPIDPETGRPWPPMPAELRTLAERAAAAGGFAGFTPDTCLINRYEPGARMSPHQDKDEQDLAAPIVSVSLGLPAVFLFGGARRSDKARRIRLMSGDVVVWGGPSRLFFHGIAPLADGSDPLTGPCRINLTFRQAL